MLILVMIGVSFRNHFIYIIIIFGEIKGLVIFFFLGIFLLIPLQYKDSLKFSLNKIQLNKINLYNS